MLTKRCLYCRRYAKTMIDNKCRACVREFEEIKKRYGDEGVSTYDGSRRKYISIPNA